jgi:hypothetical protein
VVTISTSWLRAGRDAGAKGSAEVAEEEKEREERAWQQEQ